MKPPKTLIKIGVVLLVVVAAVLVVRAVFNYVEGRKLTRTLAELKAAGIPLATRDLAAPCPESDNAARLWRIAEGLLTTEDGEDRELLSRVWRDHAAGKPIAAADKTALKGVILRNLKAFEFMAAMSLKPCFLYRDPSLPLLEHGGGNALKMIHATELLFLSALFSAEDGDVETAIDTFRTGLRFAPMVAQEGPLIAYLIAAADTRILAYNLEEICRGREIRDDTLVRLIDELDPGPWLGRLAFAIRGERVVFIEAGEIAMKGRLDEIDFLFGERSILTDIGVWLIRPVFKMDIRTALPIFQELEAQAKRPYFESRDFLRGQEGAHRKRPWYAYLSKAMMANFEAAFMKEAMLEASLLAARTGLACRLYKSRTGAYPESLEALVPGILAEVPIDPFTGKPFVYRREGEGFIVYSLGSNEKDDGGRSTYNITQMVMEKDDDWTWKEDK
jgi:hypothetical protein